MKNSLVLSETLVILLVMCLASQASSLASSIILVPSSIVLMTMISMETMQAGMLAFIFIMVFIGGLMVLLVSVASVVYQEQWVMASIFLVCISFFLAFLLKEETFEWKETNTIFLSWFDAIKMTLLLCSLVLLTIGLVVMSYLLMSFKGMIRSL